LKIHHLATLSTTTTTTAAAKKTGTLKTCRNFSKARVSGEEKKKKASTKAKKNFLKACLLHTYIVDKYGIYRERNVLSACNQYRNFFHFFWPQAAADKHGTYQGCQIFLGPNIPKWEEIYQNDQKLYQTTINYKNGHKNYK
jgi:hypothetical protein